MNEDIKLSAGQIEALVSIRDLLAAERWALIGASAIRCRLPMPRPTADVDFAVVASSESIKERLAGAGWTRHSRKLQTWVRAGATIDVIPITDEDLLAGVVLLEDGFALSVVGLDLAFSESDSIAVRDDLEVPVPRLPVLVLLKMIAWLERPYDRQKDLGDIVLMWDGALPDDDDRRWDAKRPVGAAALDYEDQSAFFCGWQIGRIAHPEHLHWVKRFVDIMRDPESAEFARLAAAARYAGENGELRLRARLTAFERGLEVGSTAAPGQAAAGRPGATPAAPATSSFAWGRSGSLQMLLHDAIDDRRVVQFEYRGQLRIAEPHVLGTKAGRLQVLTWQIAGTSSSGPLPDWRRFFVDELSNLEITGDTFAGRRLTWGRHSSFDRQIAVVR